MADENNKRNRIEISLPITCTLFLFLFFSRAHCAKKSAANAYCDNQPFWNPDGSISPGTSDWSVRSKKSAFLKGPCLGVSGIGMTETYKKTVIVIDRASATNGYLHLPGRPNDLAYAQELDLVTMAQRPLDVITNTFCSSGQHAPDGTLLSIGGDWSPDYATPGEFSIRAFSPCNDGKCGFKVQAQLARSRWYPTTALLADGRVIVVGGSSRGVGLNNPKDNVPFIEYYPRAPGEDAYRLQLLDDALPYNLYPFVHLLPSGRVFVFAGEQWVLWDTAKNAMVNQGYPKVGARDSKGNPLRFSYPVAGTSALFPLTSANNYLAEVIICGGTSTKAIYQVRNGNDANGDPKYDVTADPYYPSSNKCFRITPEVPAPKWAVETMRLPRVMPIAVLLPDGNLAIVGGTGTGYSGLGKLAHKASLTPDMYNTATHKWYTGTLATSHIPRAYHGSAVLLHDGTVFISGSNPNSDIVLGAQDFPIEFRTEFFQPPYLMPLMLAPQITLSPPAATYGSNMVIQFSYVKHVASYQVVLCQPGFSTHSGNHGMRNVVLDVVGMKNFAAGKRRFTVAVPTNRNLLPPTWYWLFVVINGVPNREGVSVFIK